LTCAVIGPVKSRDGRRQDGARSSSALRAWCAAAVEDVYLECVVLRINGFCEPVENGASSAFTPCSRRLPSGSEVVVSSRLPLFVHQLLSVIYLV
jgi:hypothetical protein